MKVLADYSKKEPYIKTKLSPILDIFVTVVICSFVILFALFNLITNSTYGKKFEKSEAVITHIIETNNDYTPLLDKLLFIPNFNRVQVQYKIEGKTMIADAKGFVIEKGVNNKVNIKYNTNDYKDVIIDELTGENATSLFLLCIGITIIFFKIIKLRRISSDIEDSF